MNWLEIIKNAYNKSQRLSIVYKDKTMNDVQVVSYTENMVRFLRGRKFLDIKPEEFIIKKDFSEPFYRDMYCKSQVDMTWEQLQSYIERAFNCNECDYEQIGNKYGSSSAKKIYVTVKGMELTAAMTYGTVTGVKFPDGTIVDQKYSVTSSQWQNRIL